MNTHLSEAQFVELYYANREAVENRSTHLDECKVCRAEFKRLTATLDAVLAFEPAETNETYGEDVWNRIGPRLQGRDRGLHFGWPQTRWVLMVGVLAGLIVTAFFIEREKMVQPTSKTAAKGIDRESKVLLVTLDDHLDRAQLVLVELMHIPKKEEVDISSERRNAKDLLADNRLYRQLATSAGDANIATVLNELEPILIEVAHEPSKLDGTEVQLVQRQIESNGLLFKIRVISSTLRNYDHSKQNSPIPKVTRQTV